MKKLLLALLAIMALVMSGCGDGSVSVVIPIEPVINPPSISLNPFTKDTANELIKGSVSFIAPTSDIDTMTVVVFDSRGHEISRTKTTITLPGVTSETILFRIDYYNFPADQFTFSIYVTDFNGNASNLVVGSFLVP